MGVDCSGCCQPAAVQACRILIKVSQLANTEEIENGKSNGALGEVLIRCNNVLYIRCVATSAHGN